MSDDRCPKCGAVAEAPQTYQRGHPSAPETITRLNWKCGSWWEEIQGFTQSVVCRAAELEQELARRRSNTTLGLRGIGAPEDDPDLEFRLGVLAGGLKAEVERLRALLYEAWKAADKGDFDGVDLRWMARCDELFASAANKTEGDAT